MIFFNGYIGTYTQGPAGRGKGIYFFRMNPVSGKIEELSLAAEAANPSWIYPHREKLYAVNEIDDFHGAKSGAVSAYNIVKNGSLELINQKPSGGMWPCHLALNSGRENKETFLFTANYFSGTAGVFSLEDSGGIGELRQLIRLEGSGPNNSRQEGPHAHCVLAKENFVFIYDLGSDRIMVYRFDPSAEKPLTPAEFPWGKSVPGAGPRHGVLSPSGNLLYSVNELDSTVDVFRFDTASGRLEKIQGLSTLPASYGNAARTCASGLVNFPAEIRVSPDGRIVCASNRGHESIAVYKVLDEGELLFVDAFPAGGNCPRSFTFDPAGNFILSANHESDIITVLSVDKDSGALKQRCEFQIPSPVCVAFT